MGVERALGGLPGKSLPKLGLPRAWDIGAPRPPLVPTPALSSTNGGLSRSHKHTDAMVSIEGENMRGVTWCVLEEVKSGDWGIAGQCLTTEAVHALAAGTPAGVS